MADEKQKREHFRLEYPIALRPKFVMQTTTYDVLDLSERGMRFFTKSTSYWAKSPGAVRGDLVFSDGKKIQVEGRVLRVTSDQVILHLNKGVPYAKMMEEQRLILKNHGRPS